MHPPSVTACLVIHDEEAVLERCLLSLRDVVSTILVVHDGPCHDQSLSICKKYHCQVFIRPFCGEAEPHRAWLLRQVQTQYCLQIDADEFLSEELVANFKNLLEMRVAAYSFLWPYWDGSTYRTRLWPRKVALYDARRIQFLAAPHEGVRVNGECLHTHYVLEHKPLYDNLSWKRILGKWKKWAQIHATYYCKDPKKIDRYRDDTMSLTIHYKAWMRFAPFSALPLAVYHCLAALYSGAAREGRAGIKSAVAMGIYYMMVSYYVGRERYAKTT